MRTCLAFLHINCTQIKEGIFLSSITELVVCLGLNSFLSFKIVRWFEILRCFPEEGCLKLKPLSNRTDRGCFISFWRALKTDAVWQQAHWVSDLGPALFSHKPRSALLLWNIWGTSSGLHFDVGVKLIDLLPEVVPEIGTFGFKGGRQEAVLDGEHLSV